jgi:hypothetical protein
MNPSNRDYDRNGPCGPTAFWKLTDRTQDDKDIARIRFLHMFRVDDTDESEDEEFEPGTEQSDVDPDLDETDEDNDDQEDEGRFGRSLLLELLREE